MFEVPVDVKAAIDALRFDSSDRRGLQDLTTFDWTSLLTRPDFVRLTIPLRQTCAEEMPGWVCSRVDRYIADNTARLELVKIAYEEFADALREAGAEHLVIKGFAQWPGFTDHPCFHAQSDIDLYCPPDSLSKANRVALALGYETTGHQSRAASDHLPALTRLHGWRWTGNHFDPDMPPGLELHRCFWNRRDFRCGVEIEQDFWARREIRQLDDLCFPALCMIDNVGHAALQILKDSLQDSLSHAKLYELARFLHLRRDDRAFWNAWSEFHGAKLRQMEAISFRAARDVFGCRLTDPVEKEVEVLPAPVKGWFDLFQTKMFDRAPQRPRLGILLQMALIESPRERRAAVIDRFRPRRPISAEVFTQYEKVIRPLSTEADFRAVRQKYRQHIRKQIFSRARALAPTLWHGVRYWWAAKDLTRQFWTFFAAAFLFDLGMYIFFLLYNLYLLDRGFNAQFIGFVTSAAAIGSVAGTVLGGWLAHRVGLHRMLVVCFPLIAAVYALRAAILAPYALVFLAFLGGAVAAFWAIGLAPAVAQLTTEKNRSFAFSVILSTGIAVGILGGFTGGHLPGWLAEIPAVSALHAKQAALLVACALVGLAAWPIVRIKFTPIAAGKRPLYPRNPFLWRFLPVIAVWSLAMGAFSPFFNTYFSERGMSVTQIGSMLSLSQAAQVIAVLAAPFLFRRAGLVKGIMLTQLAAALSLAMLAAAPAAVDAATLFTVFSAFEWMNEPGVFTLLMERVKPEERTGASTLMFLVTSGSQAIAGTLAGAGYARVGYPVVMFISAGAAVLAAVLFGTILRDQAVATPAVAASSVALARAPSEVSGIRANS